MKKSLLALAVLGAFAASAQAQTSVTIGGVIAANVKSYKVDDVTTVGRVAKRETRVDDDYTSRFWLTGSEDLGGGNSAIFYIENRLNADVQSGAGVSNGLANGDTFVGLKGAWGQATAGKHSLMNTQGFAIETGANGVPAAPSSMYGTYSIFTFAGATNVSGSRISNSVKYTTPNMGGFTGSVGVSANTAGNEGVITAGNPDYSKGQAYVLSGNYTNGPIFANLAYLNNKIEGRPAAIPTGATADTQQVRLSGSYAFPFGLKVGLGIDRATLKNVGRSAVAAGADQKRNAFLVPVSYTFGASTVLASFTKARALTNSPDSGAKMYTLGYDYALSKRTNVGVFYSKLDNDINGQYQPYLSGTSATGSALLTGESASTLALGVKHTF